MRRSYEMDLIKGIGIILVVTLHVGINSAVFTNFFNLFHMAVFFFSAGWCFNEKYVLEKGGSLKYFVRKIKTLYVPYVLFNSLLIVLNNLFLKINFYTDNEKFLTENIGIGNVFGIQQRFTLSVMIRKIFLILLGGMEGEPQLGGATWFLRVLFIITILFFVVEKLIFYACTLFKIQLNSIIVQWVIAGVLLWVGYYMKIQNRYHILTCCSIYFVYVLGHMVRHINLIERLKSKNIASVSIVLISAAILWCINGYGCISINANEYVNPLFLVTASVLGSFLCLSIAMIICNRCKLFMKIIAYIGQKSLSILLLHFTAFKMITYIEVLYYKKEPYLLAAFPVLFTTGIWRMLYILMGIALPLMCDWLLKKVRKICLQN